jgi:uncharacterized protein with von Willebrand factor type A (vWA) domain
MTENDFLERLREDARALRHEPDDVALTRLRARVRARIDAGASVAQLLASWFRPVTMSLAALSIVAALGTAWWQQSRDTVTVDTMASSSVEVSVGGDTFSVPD